MLKKRIILLLTVCVVCLALPGRLRAAPDAGPDRSLPSFRVTSLHQWIVDRMVTWAPPGASYVPEARETEEDGKRRYENIADDVISVVYDPAERPIFHGDNGRAMTAALLTSIAYYESAYRRDVDSGVGPKARGDSGRSWCLMQVKLGAPGADGRTRMRVVVGRDGGLRFVAGPKEPDYDLSWGGEDLVRDRTKCFRVAVRLARLSFGACSRLDVLDRLSMYASGKCEAGQDASRRRVGRAQRWLWSLRPPLTDIQVMGLLGADRPDSPGSEGATFFSDIASSWFM